MPLLVSAPSSGVTTLPSAAQWPSEAGGRGAGIGTRIAAWGSGRRGDGHNEPLVGRTESRVFPPRSLRPRVKGGRGFVSACVKGGAAPPPHDCRVTGGTGRGPRTPSSDKSAKKATNGASGSALAHKGPRVEPGTGPQHGAYASIPNGQRAEGRGRTSPPPLRAHGLTQRRARTATQRPRPNPDITAVTRVDTGVCSNFSPLCNGRWRGRDETAAAAEGGVGGVPERSAEADRIGAVSEPRARAPSRPTIGGLIETPKTRSTARHRRETSPSPPASSQGGSGVPPGVKRPGSRDAPSGGNSQPIRFETGGSPRAVNRADR
ncbi:hypothetical protein AAFF_G00394560 [Aldrovandia affinis]|uniref:Uncharacterized protein n=1 Tax=Aldrovandia affinis TaxID=143900 RepID=A0AAD7SE95_9TELE|nr:hypothetical protein AAFF_G00394560 [Aldrovandia affinis]